MPVAIAEGINISPKKVLKDFNDKEMLAQMFSADCCGFLV